MFLTAGHCVTLDDEGTVAARAGRLRAGRGRRDGGYRTDTEDVIDFVHGVAAEYGEAEEITSVTL